MTKVTTDDTAATGTSAMATRFSFTELEPRFHLLEHGFEVLRQMSGGDGIESEAGDAICWIVEMMQKAEHELHDLFSKLIVQKRQDWDQRDAARLALEALQAEMAGKEVAQA